MTNKYIYIDDQTPEASEPFARSIESSVKGLSISHQQPIEFSEQLRQLAESSYAGLILDLRLDETKNQHGNLTEYRATALAQELRTRATEKRVKDTPIVLLSTNTKFKQSFDRDDTSHDLFDAIFTKESVPNNEKGIAITLISLSEGYHSINEKKGSNRTFVLELLGLKKPDFGEIDPRIASEFEGQRKRLPTHEYARFILSHILTPSGPLVDEKTLAAKLGIDIDNSSDWETFKSEFLSKAEYDGLFREAMPRWWMFKVMRFWTQSIRTEIPLRSLTAKQRVKAIKASTKLSGIQEAQPIENGYSTKYWTLCKGFERPLDPLDGLLTAEPEPKVWQDKPYISIKAALERVKHNEGLRVHAFEKDRLAELKGK
jgi:hypothetical protein